MARGVETYINSRPEHLQTLMRQIRAVLLDLHPILEETVKYNTPFYQYKGKNVCYLSTKGNNNYVQLAFVKGFKLSDVHQNLVTDNRTIVRSLNFTMFTEKDKQVMLEVVYEAIELEERS
jgi:hypothetical protein